MSSSLHWVGDLVGALVGAFVVGVLVGAFVVGAFVGVLVGVLVVGVLVGVLQTRGSARATASERTTLCKVAWGHDCTGITG